jgi:hypothetical protein
LNDKIYGAISLIIFASAMTIEDAIERYSQQLADTAHQISAEFSAQSEDKEMPVIRSAAGEAVPQPLQS